MNDQRPPELDELFRQLAALIEAEEAASDDPLTQMSREYLDNTWQATCEGPLARSKQLRFHRISPSSFGFEIDRPFKRATPGGPVELAPGPIRGTIMYRANLFSAAPGEATVVVLIDREHNFHHPNFSPRFGAICLGDLPHGPIALDALLVHVFQIVSYQNRNPLHPADIDAARYFAFDPNAMSGLEQVEPLY